MSLSDLWQSIEASPVGDFVASSSWAFPMLECVHVIAITTVIGTIAVMDFRLLGLASTETAVTEVSTDTLKWTWGAFALAFVSGALIWTSKAHIYMVDPWFYRKMIAMALAGLNMGLFHVFTWRSIGKWDTAAILPKAAKFAGATSLFLWVLVTFFGRAIGFTLGKYE